jgi:putative ATP-binding cassette transporter
MNVIRFDRQTVKRLYTLTKPFFMSDVKWKARGLVLLLAAFSISATLLNKKMNYLFGDFWNALMLKNREDFMVSFSYYLLIGIAIGTPVSVFYSFTEQRLALFWRRWMSPQDSRSLFQGPLTVELIQHWHR